MNRRSAISTAVFLAFAWMAAAAEGASAGPPGRGVSAYQGGLERGRLLYRERCLFCHGEEGAGWNHASRASAPPVKVPDLRDPAFMGRFNRQELFKVIKEGGTREGKSRFMPPSGLWLSDEDIGDIILYVRSLERRPSGAQKGR